PAMKPFEGMKTYTTLDEWYSFKENPRPNVNVLAKLDESTIKKGKNDDWKMGDHPLIWWNDKGGIRSFYTVFGHTHEAFEDELIIEHIKNAINWAARRID
ncbi:MAG: ThuA domain-containing protein, partial [Bacteroidales bacterium]|nr:ThuA domain-containing protein [Bacteroidales bacterium]